jgi:hypothetical protein
MEVPDLSLSSIWSLDDHVSVVDKIEISVTWHRRDNVEISFDVKSELLVQLSLLWLRIIVNIDNLPLLSVKIVTSVAYLDVSVFSISVEILVLNFKNLTFLINNQSSFSLEELPPSRVSSGTSDIG